jgi:hypothetical protein
MQKTRNLPERGPAQLYHTNAAGKSALSAAPPRKSSNRLPSPRFDMVVRAANLEALLEALKTS